MRHLIRGIDCAIAGEAIATAAPAAPAVLSKLRRSGLAMTAQLLLAELVGEADAPAWWLRRS
jgi:hypothetical protein